LIKARCPARRFLDSNDILPSQEEINPAVMAGTEDTVSPQFPSGLKTEMIITKNRQKVNIRRL
jgi:hypothetical protein